MADGIILKMVKFKLMQQQKPQPGDMIVNPLSEFKTVAEKRVAYNRELTKYVAWTDFGETIPLGMHGAEFNNVDFIGGLWRVQRQFNHEVVQARDGREFVLGKKLSYQEHTKFEFYDADLVGINCYGRYIVAKAPKIGFPGYVMAKYETDKGTFWAYGDSITKARAFLAIKLYDEYQNVIEETIQQKKGKSK